MSMVLQPKCDFDYVSESVRGFAVQALSESGRWYNTSWAAFRRGEYHSYSMTYAEYFTRDDPIGKELKDCAGRMPHYACGEFWNFPCWNNADDAVTFCCRAIEGGWTDSDLRIVEFEVEKQAWMGQVFEAKKDDQN